MHDQVIRRTAGRPRFSMKEHGPQRILTSVLRHRGLIGSLVWREIESRYRGSILGVAWSLIVPAVMLIVYTIVFSIIFKARWSAEIDRPEVFALVLFAGLIVFQFFSESITRAPTLLLQNLSYIKKVVFPLEILAWVSIGTALVSALSGIAMLLLAHCLLIGLPPWTAVFFPLVLVPLALLILGGVWFLSSLGVYLRDMNQVIASVIPILMFMSPVFYTIEAIPVQFHIFIHANPLTFIIGQMRNVLLQGKLPDLAGLALYTAVALVVAWAGYIWFCLTKHGFSDVV